MRILKNGTFEDLYRIADVRFTPDELAAMRGEGIHMVSDPDVAETDVMKGVDNRKRDIRALVGRIALPRIMYPSADHVVEMNGRQYYVIHVAPPQPKKNPEGTIYMLDVETGDPARFPFMRVADRLRAVGRDSYRRSVDELNGLISRWNERIGQIDSVTNPSTWPLQLRWASDVIDERLETLDAQERSLMGRLDSATNFPPSLSSTVERIKADVAAGRVPAADLIDSILFVQHNDPDSLAQMLESPTVPEDVKEKVRTLVRMRSDAEEAERASEQAEGEARAQRMDQAATEEDISGMLAPGGQEMVPVTEKSLEDAARRKTRVPDRYYSPQGLVGQIRRTLFGVRRDKEELLKVKGAFDGMRGFVAGLEKGERAGDLLRSTERGAEIKRAIADFAHRCRGFIRRYKVPVFVRDEATGRHEVNQALLGTTGGAGNAKVAVAVSHMVNVVVNGLKAHASPQGPEDIDVAALFSGDYHMLPQDMP